MKHWHISEQAIIIRALLLSPTQRTRDTSQKLQENTNSEKPTPKCRFFQSRIILRLKSCQRVSERFSPTYCSFDGSAATWSQFLHKNWSTSESWPESLSERTRFTLLTLICSATRDYWKFYPSDQMNLRMSVLGFWTCSMICTTRSFWTTLALTMKPKANLRSRLWNPYWKRIVQSRLTAWSKHSVRMDDQNCSCNCRP